MDINVDTLGVDLLTVVGHKFGAPKGVAALYVRSGTNLPKMLHGGGQESGRRAGTESVVLLSALGEAARIARVEATPLRAHMAKTRDLLKQLLVDGLPEGATRDNGPADPACRLPNTLSIGIAGVRSSELLANLSEQLAASAGAASLAAAVMTSVLMDVPLEYAVGTPGSVRATHDGGGRAQAARLIIKEATRQLPKRPKSPRRHLGAQRP